MTTHIAIHHHITTHTATRHHIAIRHIAIRLHVAQTGQSQVIFAVSKLAIVQESQTVAEAQEQLLLMYTAADKP